MAAALSAVRTGDARGPLRSMHLAYRNELRVVATPQGLAAAFTIDQPASERRMKPRTPRDSETLTGDSVSLMLDFDATGQIGYEFSVGLGGGVRDGLITNQNEFDRDWDGVWQHAVRESRGAMVRRAADSLVDRQHAALARSAAHDRRVCIALPVRAQ